MENLNAKIEKYQKLAKKKPEYYVSIGNLYTDDGDFKNATIYYQKAVDNGVLAYTLLGDTWGYRSQYKKAFDVYNEGANKGEAECFARLGFCYENGYVKIDIQKQSSVTPKPPIWVSRQRQDRSVNCIISILRLKIPRLKTLKMR